MYNIFQKQIYLKHYNIIRASHRKLTSWSNSTHFSNIKFNNLTYGKNLYQNSKFVYLPIR